MVSMFSTAVDESIMSFILFFILFMILTIGNVGVAYLVKEDR